MAADARKHSQMSLFSGEMNNLIWMQANRLDITQPGGTPVTACTVHVPVLTCSVKENIFVLY